MAVEGRLRIDSFENADGERKKVVEVVAQNVQFLGGPTRSAEPGTVSEGASPAAPGATEDEIKGTDEEVPF